MLVWINGAFGAGKTLVANELGRRVSGSLIADPELLGIALHQLLPPPARQDFQDLPQWRTGVVATLAQSERANPGPVIVPMTIVSDAYFDEIIGGLRSREIELRHYTLMATPETLRGRLQRRERTGWGLGRALGRTEDWALQHIDRCVEALADDRYALHVTTDDRTPNELVELIAADSGLNLSRPRLSAPRERLRRLEITVRHVRP